MSTHPPFRKVFEGIATRSQMFALFNRHRDKPGVDPLSGVPYASEWFEISASEYQGYPSAAYMPPDCTEKYRDTDRHWINECVAVGDRILMLFVANSDEMFVVRSAKAAGTERPQPS
ncbi:MAG: DUF1419 domain-containing protein [Mesorhizobium sp.]|nr:MAG: DUF1419 domain-containing protein [Mesorhizobium sp.]